MSEDKAYHINIELTKTLLAAQLLRRRHSWQDEDGRVLDVLEQSLRNLRGLLTDGSQMAALRQAYPPSYQAGHTRDG